MYHVVGCRVSNDATVVAFFGTEFIRERYFLRLRGRTCQGRPYLYLEIVLDFFTGVFIGVSLVVPD